MGPLARRPRIGRLIALGAGWIVLLAAGCGPAPSAAPASVADLELPPMPEEASSEQVHQFCGACHAYPPADTFPRRAWRRELRQAYDFLRNSTLRIDYPPFESVARYYETRAPEELAPPVPGPYADHACPVRFEHRPLAPHELMPLPEVANLNPVHIYDPRRLDLLVCDMGRGRRQGRVMVLQPYENPPRWRTLAQATSPARAEVVDLDGDGRADVLVANLGSPTPTNEFIGSVLWLRATSGGTFTPITLLEGVGRVADVRAADFNGDGKLDLVVAVFGWRETGEVLYLENRTTDWSRPVFVSHRLDERHGAIHVPVADLNGDGKPDFVALISQEHETVVAFLNEGGGRFRKETLYTAPHPAYGVSGIQLADLDGDGDLDVLLANGDVFDVAAVFVLRPYHSVQWLENKGQLRFEHHHLAAMPGVMAATAADIDGDGDLDILAVSCLPGQDAPERDTSDLDSVILLEQVAPRRFVRHSLQKKTCIHMTCAAGDFFGDGRLHLAIGHFSMSGRPVPSAVTLWKNVPAARTSSGR